MGFWAIFAPAHVLLLMPPVSYQILLPELALVLAFLVELGLLALPGKRIGGWVALVAIGFSLVGVLWRAQGLPAEPLPIPFLTLQLASWQTPFLAVADVAAFVSVLWLHLARKPTRYEAGPLSFFLLSGLAGAHVLVLAHGPVLSFLALETLSLASYAGMAWPGRKSALQATLRYALLGIFSSACLAYGLSWSYGLSLLPPSDASRPAWLVAQALLLVGVLFKQGAFPLHGWVPRIYEAAPLPMVAFLSVAPKVASLGWVSNLAYFSQTTLPQIDLPLAVVGAASVLAGNVGAFYQTRFLRLMGFSSVAHAGFMLLCLACPAPLEVAGSYSLALLGINYMAFGLWGQLQAAGAGPELATVSGWAKGHTLWALLAVVSGLALAGLPPTVGFVAKFKLVLGLAKQHQAFGAAWAYGLAAFVALNTAVSLYYYLKLPYYLIFKSAGRQPEPPRQLARVALLALGAALIFFFFAAQALDGFID